jgi:hypothetical protein
VLTWLDLGDPSRDEEFARCCLAGVNALWEAWNAPVAEKSDQWLVVCREKEL